MQTPPNPWNPQPAPSATKVLLVAFGLIAAIILIVCGGGGLLFWRLLPIDQASCADLTVSGRFKEAIAPCRADVAERPEDAEAHNDLGWSLMMLGQTTEGVAEARKAIQLRPTRDAYDTLAMGLALSGQGNEALRVETDHVMVKGDVGDPTRRVTLGMAEYAAGKKQEAHHQWELARTSSDDDAKKLAAQFEAKYP